MAYQFEKSGKLKNLTDKELAVADADSAVIVLSNGVMENGTPYWLYIAVKPSKYKEFMQFTAEQRPINIKEYGAVLKYGIGKEVPADVREEMKREHGCDEHYLATLAEDIEKAQIAFLKQQEDQKIGDIVATLKKNNPDGNA